jgi:hypothetical protein
VLVRCSSLALIAALASPVRADWVAPPGTADDPLTALTLLPEVVDAPLYPGLVLRGGDPADTMVMLDGFELPTTFHGTTGLRSLLIPETVSTPIARDVFALGRASSYLLLQSHAAPTIDSYRFSNADFNGRFRFGEVGSAAARTGYLPQVYIDTFAHVENRTPSSRQALTILTSSYDASLGRIVARTQHRKGAWRFFAALSPMADTSMHRLSIDGRLEASHTGSAAGLRQLTWSFGLDSANSRYDLDRVYWTPDLGTWVVASAALSKNIVARGGVRMDAFLRTHDVATQPRASIRGRFGTSEIELEAGAFRRPAEKRFELPLDLNPERTTQLSARFTRSWFAKRDGVVASITGYYVDRTRLITPDSTGSLGNNGLATAKGVELQAFGVRGRWIVMLGTSLSSSMRRDYFRARERPSDFDQPVRLDAFAIYRAKRWHVSARFSLSSGLPYTPVVESGYDSDADSYVPVYGFTNSERLPWMHSLDIRGDIKLSRFWSAFAEIRNAYAASTALGYQYSFDYKQRLDVTLPILPYVGLRCDL